MGNSLEWPQGSLKHPPPSHSPLSRIPVPSRIRRGWEPCLSPGPCDVMHFFTGPQPVTRGMWSLHNGPFVRRIRSRNPRRTGTRPVHFQKVQPYAFISPGFLPTSLHPTLPFLVYTGPSGHYKRGSHGEGAPEGREQG